MRQLLILDPFTNLSWSKFKMILLKSLLYTEAADNPKGKDSVTFKYKGKDDEEEKTHTISMDTAKDYASNPDSDYKKAAVAAAGLDDKKPSADGDAEEKPDAKQTKIDPSGGFGGDDDASKAASDAPIPSLANQAVQDPVSGKWHAPGTFGHFHHTGHDPGGKFKKRMEKDAEEKAAKAAAEKEKQDADKKAAEKRYAAAAKRLADKEQEEKEKGYWDGKDWSTAPKGDELKKAKEAYKKYEKASEEHHQRFGNDPYMMGGPGPRPSDFGPDAVNYARLQSAKFKNSSTITTKSPDEKGPRQTTNRIGGNGGHNVLLANPTKEHIKRHNKPGEGSVFSDKVKMDDIENAISDIPEEFYEKGGGVHTTTVPNAGFNLVQKASDIEKNHPNARKIKVKKQVRGEMVEVDAYIVDNDMEEFATDQLNVVVRPSNPDFMDDEVKNDSDVQQDLKDGKSHSVLTSFPGDPDVPSAEEWGESGHAIIIPNGGRGADKTNWVEEPTKREPRLADNPYWGDNPNKLGPMRTGTEKIKTINGKKYRAIKEEKKPKKHKLQETYERIANRMVT